jgi:zinc protease
MLKWLDKLKVSIAKVEEIQKVKNKIESTLQFSEINILDKAMNLAYSELLGDANHINEEINKYQAVTGEDILRSAQEVFRTDNCSTLYYYAN